MQQACFVPGRYAAKCSPAKKLRSILKHLPAQVSVRQQQCRYSHTHHIDTMAAKHIASKAL